MIHNQHYYFIILNSISLIVFMIVSIMFSLNKISITSHADLSPPLTVTQEAPSTTVTQEAPSTTVTQEAPNTTVTQEAQSVNQHFYFGMDRPIANKVAESKPSESHHHVYQHGDVHHTDTPYAEAADDVHQGDVHHTDDADYADAHHSNIVVPKIKQSSLSYLNSSGRVGFDFNKYYNDFTNEGHMYPVHGVGDLDKTRDLMGKFLKSASGEQFGITDLGINIKVTRESLITQEPFFDHHNIPTRLLDGSTLLADGSRVEQHIPYFTGENRALAPVMEIDWISGNARLVEKNDANAAMVGLADPAEQLPTTLTSTRATPFLKQDEYLALTFFADGPQNRVNNNSTISNWRYVVPNFVKAPIFWFVAKAYVPCDKSEAGAEYFETTDGSMAWGRPRKAGETEDLNELQGKNRLMKTVSKAVKFEHGADKMQAFNQRYGNKTVDFGDIIVRDNVMPKASDNTIIQMGNAKYQEMMDKFHDKQIAFQEMTHLLAIEMIAHDTYYVPKVYEVNAFAEGTDEHPRPAGENNCEKVWNYVIDNYINAKTYKIGLRGLNNKAQLPKSWLPGSVGETGWLVVDAPSELVVPDEDGEFFIGWSISTQPHNGERSSSANDKTVGNIAEKLAWTQANGYASAQGPGLMFLSSEYGSGTQEPFILEASKEAAKQTGESDDDFKRRKQLTLPQVHWRLDAPDVIFKSLEMGAVTQANVGHNQRMLVSIGSKTALSTPSRSQNFLGRYYQELLGNKEALLELVTKTPDVNEVYEIESVEDKLFIYGDEQAGAQDVPTYY